MYSDTPSKLVTPMYYGTPVNELLADSVYPMQIDFVSENTLLKAMENVRVILLLIVCLKRAG